MQTVSAETRLNGKTAVITGVSKAMGFAAARAYHAQRAKLVLFRRKQDSLEAAIRSMARSLSAELLDRQGFASTPFALGRSIRIFGITWESRQSRSRTSVRQFACKTR